MLLQIHRLVVGIDRPLVLRLDFVSLSPLPVVVAVVVDLLDRDRRFWRDVIWEVVGSLFHLVLVYLFLETILTFLVLG